MMQRTLRHRQRSEYDGFVLLEDDSCSERNKFSGLRESLRLHNK